MEIESTLAFIGAATILSILILSCVFLWEFTKETISEFKWRYKRKHRFDKPPTAACYCRDCVYYQTKNGFGKCRRGHIDSTWNIADSWFCWQAEPLKCDPELLKKTR